MAALLDVNVLIALLDSDHSLHGRAAAWFEKHGRLGWASCPITQNGCVRIMSSQAYPSPLSVQSIAERLAEAAASPHHSFWPDDISLLDSRIVDTSRIHTPRQLTDLYLLALAVRRGGSLATFDDHISIEAVKGAAPRHLARLY